MDIRNLISLEAAGKAAHIAPRKLREAARNGDLEVCQPGSRNLYTTPEAVSRWLVSTRPPTAAERARVITKGNARRA